MRLRQHCRRAYIRKGVGSWGWRYYIALCILQVQCDWSARGGWVWLLCTMGWRYYVVAFVHRENRRLSVGLMFVMTAVLYSCNCCRSTCLTWAANRFSMVLSALRS